MKNTKSQRVWAFIIDALAVGMLTGIVQSVLPSLFSFHETEFANINLRLSFGGPMMTYFLYFLLFDIANEGKTLGKLLLKIRVVEESGEPLTPSRHILRSIVKIVSIAFLPIAAIVYLVSDAQTLHARALNTKTIETK